MAEIGDEILMKQLNEGNRLAFELLYNRYFDKLVGFAVSFLGDVQKAEDVVQEVFMKIIDQPEQFDQDRKFSTWIYTVTGNKCRNLIRDEQNRAKIVSETRRDSESNTIHHDSDLQLLTNKIQRTLATLSEKEKSLYVLRFEQELSIKEISAIVNIPEGSVKSGVYYLLKKFATQLKEFTHGN